MKTLEQIREMSDEEKRIKIAESMGWHDWRGIDEPVERVKAFGEVIPDYLNDLNAYHEMEKVLSDAQHYYFRENLFYVICRNMESENPPPPAGRRMISSPGRDRCEAFLMTVLE